MTVATKPLPNCLLSLLLEPVIAVPRLMDSASKLMKPTLILDIETYKNFFCAVFKRLSDGKTIVLEKSDRKELDRKRLSTILQQYRIITFNGMNYDLPICWLAVKGSTNEQLKHASDLIIKTHIRWWEVNDALKIAPPKIDHIDLFEVNPSVNSGLKILAARLHAKRLQELPFPPDTVLTHEQMDSLIDYCANSDIPGTELLFDALQEPIALRERFSKDLGVDVRSKSDAQMGETIIKKRIEKITGKKAQRTEGTRGSLFKYDVPSFIKFESPMLQEMLEVIRNTDFVVKGNGKIDLPPHITALKITIGSSTYQMGIGGLHSKENARGLESNDTHVLIDADVASQYPKIISILGLYPKSVGPVFKKVYDGIILDRLTAKKLKDAIGSEGLKIALNGGGYGKLGSAYSVLYAPHLLLAVTLTGQLSLLMLIERAEREGISVVSGNTDGVMFYCPRHLVGDDILGVNVFRDRLTGGRLKEIVDQWESEAGMTLESQEYRAVYSRDVNCYIAIKNNGKAKRKGYLANHWDKNSPDYSLREQMKKNFQMTICSDAALAFILSGKAIADTIYNYNDIRGFLTITVPQGGGTWRGSYLGKAVRFMWSTDGDPILKRIPNDHGTFPMVQNTSGCRPVMNLPDELPDDIDYERYIHEAHEILYDVGYRVRPFDTVWAGIIKKHMKIRKWK